MGKKEEEQQQRTNQTQYRNHKGQERVEAVIELLRKQSPLTLKQEKFCNRGCVERFLRAEGDNVKKAAKHLRACLSWRETIGIENLTADEFSAELAEGFAYVAGHDEESRPVLICRLKQDYHKLQSQKLWFTRLLAFTLEVAMGTMQKNVDQLVLLIDASFFRSASSIMNLVLVTLKIVAEYYPGRLYKAFIIDPPSMFSYLWKGVRPFVDLSKVTMVISSLEFDDPLDFNDFTSCSRSSSLRFESPSIKSTAKIGSCTSTRFSFTVSPSSDALKPWHLTLTDASSSKVGLAQISPVNARSFSFSSPVDRTPRGSTINYVRHNNKTMFPSTPLPQRVTPREPMKVAHPRTPLPCFLQSPAVFFKRECHVSKAQKVREAFVPFLKFYRKPYNEMVYRSKMRAPLGGIISIVPSHLRSRHVSQSLRF